MEHIAKKEREDIYLCALHTYGFEAQAVVAVEELSEAQKEICKTIRDIGNRQHLAEEIADARIMLEQMELYTNTKAIVEDEMDRKLIRLRRRLHGEGE